MLSADLSLEKWYEKLPSFINIAGTQYTSEEVNSRSIRYGLKNGLEKIQLNLSLALVFSLSNCFSVRI